MAATSSVSGLADTRRVKVAVDQLTKAQSQVSAAGLDLLNVAHAIRNAAVQELKGELLRSLLQEEFLEGIDGLRILAPPNSNPAEVHLLSEALLNWFCRHFDIAQYLSRGQVLEVPVERLREYELDGHFVNPTKALISLRVLAPGWKRKGEVLVAPKAEVFSNDSPGTKNPEKPDGQPCATP